MGINWLSGISDETGYNGRDRKMLTIPKYFSPSALALLVFLLSPAGCSPKSEKADKHDGGPDTGLTDAEPDDGAPLGDRIEIDAHTSVCGNGILEEGEVCDDGNTVSGDGCNSTCTLIDSWDYVAAHYTQGNQNQPAVACNDDIIAAAWTDWSGFDGDGAGIRLRLFGTDAMPIETVFGNKEELRVNVTVVGHQYQPDLALTPEGDIVVVWTDLSKSAGDPGDIRMQIYNPDGSRVGTEVLVNTTTAGDQQTPAVTVADNGTIFVVWADGSGEPPDTDAYGIRGRLFTPDGNPMTNGVTGDASDFVLNTVVQSIQRDPTVSSNGAGGFFVAWSDASGVFDDDGYGITAVVLGPDGSHIVTDFGVNTSTSGHQFGPKADLQPGHGPAVFWTDGSLTDDMQETGIRGRLIGTGGGFRQNHLGHDEDFPVNTITSQAQELPVIATQPDGKMLVIWQDWSGSDGSASAIVGRALDPTGAGIPFLLSDTGDDFVVNTTFIGAQHSPTVCNTGSWSIAFWTDESGAPPSVDSHAVRFRLLPEF